MCLLIYLLFVVRNAARNIHQVRFVRKPGLGIPTSSTPYQQLCCTGTVSRMRRTSRTILYHIILYVRMTYAIILYHIILYYVISFVLVFFLGAGLEGMAVARRWCTLRHIRRRLPSAERAQTGGQPSGRPPQRLEGSHIRQFASHAHPVCVSAVHTHMLDAHVAAKSGSRCALSAWRRTCRQPSSCACGTGR